MIAFSCARCQHKIEVKDEFAGRGATCPRCKGRLTVPPAAVPSMACASGGAADGQVASRRQADAGDSLAATVTKADVVIPKGQPSLEFLMPPGEAGDAARLGPYRILKFVGAGNMGIILQAEDTSLKRVVALKVMRPELAAVALNRERFLREAQAAAAIEHPNVVTIHQVGEDHGVPFIAMPFLKGEALDARIKREGRLSVLDAARIGRQIADGLAAAHERGLVHRDVKPANVWLEAGTGLVKILDFGLARSVDGLYPSLTQAGAMVGTPAFMAPEQARGDRIDHRADLFSLGSVLYQTCSGELPFKGGTIVAMLAALVGPTTPRPLRAVNPGVSQALADLVGWLLAKDPVARPVSARHVSEALAAIEREASPADAISSSVGASVLLPPEPRSGRWLLHSGLVVAAALLLLIGLVTSSTFRARRATVAANVRTDGAGWVQLFNGKDLAGWKVFPRGTGKWTVEDGCVVGSGDLSHLFSARGDYKNFRFRVEAKINAKGNSGQYFRAKYESGLPSGYEAQINSTHGDPVRTGSLYPDGRLKLAAGEREKIIVKDMLVKPNEWFTQEVIAIGNHLVIRVNGQTTVDWTDPNDSFAEGYFALQHHDPGSRVCFRKIEVQELPDQPKAFVAKDLDGWEGLIKEYWSIADDGALIGQSREPAVASTYLCSKKRYKDFDLSFKVKLTGTGWSGNSGIQFRGKIRDAKRFDVTGPQCDMGQSYWGSLTGEHLDRTGGTRGGVWRAAPEEVLKKVLRDNDFNDYHVRCVGKHVTIKLNDAITVDHDFENLPEEGIIAFQLHGGGPMKVIFKDIRFMDLGGD